MNNRARSRRGRSYPNETKPYPGVPTPVFSYKCLLGFAAALHGSGLLLYLMLPETPEKIRIRHERLPPAEDFASWLEETTYEQRHELRQAHMPLLPLLRRIDDPINAFDAKHCGPWYSHYLSVHRATQGRHRAPVVVPPPEGSHGIGDWEMQALRLARGAIKDGAPVFVDWPDAFERSGDDAQLLEDGESREGALAPVTSTMEVLYRPSRHAKNALTDRDFEPWQHASLEKVPDGPVADACILGSLLPPSESALAATAATRSVLADPHALTIGIHVRSGFADGRPPLPRSSGNSGADLSATTSAEAEEAREAWRLASVEWQSLAEAAVDCALALEEQWRGDRPRIVWLLTSDGDPSNHPDSLGKDVKTLLKERDKLHRPPEEGGGPARALVTGHRGSGRGLHTGPDYQHLHEASSSSSSNGYGGGREGRDVGNEGRGGRGAEYSTIISAALNDQLLLASCDFVVAASGHVVTGTSAFARSAAKRGGHGPDSVFATSKPGNGGQCAPVPRL